VRIAKRELKKKSIKVRLGKRGFAQPSSHRV
jgi:hypothetical protein